MLLYSNIFALTSTVYIPLTTYLILLVRNSGQYSGGTFISRISSSDHRMPVIALSRQS